MTGEKSRIKAVYSDYPKFLEALKSVSANREDKVEAFSPMPLEDVEHILPGRKSGVRWFTLLGGISGLAFGILFPVYTVLDWPLITGGKPVVSIPTFIVIGFELTILFGALSTLIGLLLLGKMPRIRLRDYDTRFSEYSFGIVTEVDDKDIEDFSRMLTAADDIQIEKVEDIYGEET